MGRQVKDVILHDPGGNDQDRFGANRDARRRVLNELNQSVAINDLARRFGEVAANLESVGPGQLLARDGALGVLHVILKALDQVESAGGDCAQQDFGIGQQKIRWREHVEDLPRCEFDHVFVAFGDAAQAGRGVVPPLLLQEKALLDEIDGKVAPGRVRKAMVLRQWGNAVFSLSS